MCSIECWVDIECRQSYNVANPGVVTGSALTNQGLTRLSRTMEWVDTWDVEHMAINEKSELLSYQVQGSRMCEL
ncbi:hypothetical protein Dsin_010129 [Dipteronia sinensis]|uniref:Uncharacterized protein n=1 Tax=Dipteronia sinensis TaxID=43782 RepID=A0AAE0ECJ7_9ROSI|nr:hypothetical protein Dsin_010129 [Dipteronia sinensis]